MPNHRNPSIQLFGVKLSLAKNAIISYYVIHPNEQNVYHDNVLNKKSDIIEPISGIDRSYRAGRATASHMQRN
jgi:hypothetical protein